MSAPGIVSSSSAPSARPGASPADGSAVWKVITGSTRPATGPGSTHGSILMRPSGIRPPSRCCSGRGTWTGSGTSGRRRGTGRSRRSSTPPSLYRTSSVISPCCGTGCEWTSHAMRTLRGRGLRRLPRPRRAPGHLQRGHRRGIPGPGAPRQPSHHRRGRWFDRPCGGRRASCRPGVGGHRTRPRLLCAGRHPAHRAERDRGQYPADAAFVDTEVTRLCPLHTGLAGTTEREGPPPGPPGRSAPGFHAGHPCAPTSPHPCRRARSLEQTLNTFSVGTRVLRPEVPADDQLRDPLLLLAGGPEAREGRDGEHEHDEAE